MIDILFSSVPITDTKEPVMAPAALKAIAISAGFSSKAIDLNAELLPLINQHPNSKKIIEFLMHNNLHSDVIDDVVELVNIAAEKLLSFNSKTIGLSLLTFYCQVFTYWLCVRLKALSPDTQIIIGGTGIKHTLVSNKNEFCEDLKNRNLIDYYITGDAELSLVEFLKGNYAYSGINSETWGEVIDLNLTPYPNYDDYNFSLYENAGIPIVDSRGCVRECEFCDIIEHWKKFRYRSAESIFNEMLAQIEKYKIYKFNFLNSLTNGNLKEFKKLMHYIAEYNHHNTDSKTQISWNGYFIIRSESQHNKDLWELMAKTNPTLLLGVESVVKHVRWGMGKKFNNEDIDHHLIMAKQYQIKLVLLLIVGYPTETRADYEFTKQWFRDRVELYGYNNPVKYIGLSHPAILENTQLERNADKLNLERGKYMTVWFNKDTQISPEERVKYYEELYNICKPFNPPKGVRLDGYKTLEKLINK